MDGINMFVFARGWSIFLPNMEGKIGFVYKYTYEPQMGLYPLMILSAHDWLYFWDKYLLYVCTTIMKTHPIWFLLLLLFNIQLLV